MSSVFKLHRFGLLCAIVLFLTLIMLAAAPASVFVAATVAPTNTRPPTDTRTPRPPTDTRTPRPSATPPPTMVIMGTYDTPVKPPLTAIPPPLATPKASGHDVVTILLLGSDTITHTSASRTDVIVLLSIDRTTGTANLMQIPRDMFVYIPNGTMDKINTVMNTGNLKDGQGSGAKLLEQTLLYNFGIKADFYARVDFVQFEDLVAKLGGLEISVDCAIQGNRLKSPELDYNNADNYELYTLPMGFHKLSPYMALWYVRSRGSSSDYDRGRRQIDVLRAMWRQAKNAGLLSQVTTLYPEVQKLVETDMTLQDILGFVPVALSLDPTKIQRLQLRQGTEFKVGKNLGTFALLVQPEAMQSAVQNFFMPPPSNRLNGEAPSVEIGAGLTAKGLDQVAADDLSWAGFAATTLGQQGVVNRDATVIFDYTGNAKPSSLQTLMQTLRTTQVVQKPDPNRTVDFHVEMGRDYASCLYALPAGEGVTPQPK